MNPTYVVESHSAKHPLELHLGGALDIPQKREAVARVDKINLPLVL